MRTMDEVVHELLMDKHVKAFLKELKKVYIESNPKLHEHFRKISLQDNDPDIFANEILNTLVEAEEEKKKS